MNETNRTGKAYKAGMTGAKAGERAARDAGAGKGGAARVSRGPSDSSERARVKKSVRASEALRRQRARGVAVSAGRAPRQGDGTKNKKAQGETGLARRDERQLAEARKEERWQKGVERIRVGHDRILFILVVLLLSIGVVMVYSASYPTAIAEGKNGFFYAGRQLMWIGIGSVAMLITAFMPIKFIKRMSIPFYGITAILLCLVLVFGSESGGAKRWIRITSSVKFQPSEFAKVALVMALAWYADRMSDKIKNSENGKQKFLYGVFLPSLFIFTYAGLVILEKHLSGTLIIVVIGVVVMFLAGAGMSMIPYYSVLGIGGAVAYVLYNPYALRRILTYADKEADILDEKWQTYQGSLAIGSGGFLGLGLGQSRQKFSYVSEAQNDFIFTIWCEEMGFVGAVLVIALFLALIFRGYKVALRAPDTFSSLLVFGIMTQLGVQVFLNLMVVTDIIPNTGISLPFLSYGGTSLAVMMAEMGLVLSVSRRSYQKLQ